MKAKQNQGLPIGYTLLWVIVIAFAVFVFISHMIFFVGHGRWVCTEYKTICEKCEIEGTRIAKIDQQVKQECVNEVWTKKK